MKFGIEKKNCFQNIARASREIIALAAFLRSSSRVCLLERFDWSGVFHTQETFTVDSVETHRRRISESSVTNPEEFVAGQARDAKGKGISGANASFPVVGSMTARKNLGRGSNDSDASGNTPQIARMG